MVNRAKQRIKDYSEVAKRHSNIKSIVFSAVASDGRYLPTEWTNTFDICLASFSVIFFPDPVAGLKEIHRSLVPSSGIVALSAWGDTAKNSCISGFPGRFSRIQM
mmetsp:Transcript_21556/g.31889  ORF Transcript_21556/g.31889 Transcript_21556/m.31889 type:complete len:105 (+) Transcript_21556:361-675(+)